MAEKFLTQEQLSAFCSSLAMLLRSGASLSEASSLFEEDGMDTALRQASTEISLSVAAGGARFRAGRVKAGGGAVFGSGGKDRRFPGIRLERF